MQKKRRGFRFSVFLRVWVYLTRCAVSSLAIMCVSPLSLLPVALYVRFLVARDAETRRDWRQQQAGKCKCSGGGGFTGSAERNVAVRDAEARRAWQQQQANANAAAEAALQAQQEETIRRAGDYQGGSRNAKHYGAIALY